MDDEDTSGGTLYDKSAYDNHGTNNGATTGSDGVINEAYTFNPANSDYVGPVDNPMSDTQTFTVSIWGKIFSTSNYQTAFGNSGVGFWVEFRRNGSGTGASWQFGGTDGNTREINSGIVLNTDQWYHLVGTYDGNTAKIYIDGIEEGSISTSATINMPNSWTIGSWDGGGNVHDGDLDDVRLYNRALTASEISQLYNKRT
jgi:hypothetical protein